MLSHSRFDVKSPFLKQENEEMDFYFNFNLLFFYPISPVFILSKTLNRLKLTIPRLKME